jgi:hypothetical protein
VADAQEKGASSFALGAEANMHTFKKYSGAAYLYYGYGLTNLFAVGAKAGISYNFNSLIAVEGEAFFRYSFLKAGRAAFFVQAGAGAVPVFVSGEYRRTLALGSLAAGCRLALGAFYLEPYVRSGYPHLWGAGLFFGLSPKRRAP